MTDVTKPLTITLRMHTEPVDPNNIFQTQEIWVEGGFTFRGPDPVVPPMATPVGVTLSPPMLKFSYQLGGTAPAAQMFNVAPNPDDGVTRPLSVGVTTQDLGMWLSATAAGAKFPTNVSVQVNPSKLAHGTYMGSVSVSSTLIAGGSVTLPLTLHVTPRPGLLVTPRSLTFQVPLGQVSSPQSLTFSAEDGSIPDPKLVFNSPIFTVTRTGTATRSVVCDATTVGPGSYSIVMWGASATTQYTVSIQSTCVVTDERLMSSPGLISLSATEGSTTPVSAAANLTWTGSGSVDAVVHASGGAWLQAPASPATIPGALTVSADPSGLAAGSYMGQLDLQAPGARNFTIPVNLTITPRLSLTAAPSALTFESTLLGAQAVPQQVMLSGGGALDYTVNAMTADGGSWLNIMPGSGSLPADPMLTVAVDAAGLSPGTYTGTVSVESPTATAPAQVGVAFTVLAAPQLTATPSTLSLSAGELDSGPAMGQFTLRTDNGDDVSWTATTNAPWLTLSDSSFNRPIPVGVEADPAGLAAGRYTAAIEVVSAAVSNSPFTIPVSFEVTAAEPLSLAPSMLTFDSTLLGAQAARQQLLLTAASSHDFMLQVSTADGGGWLSVTPGQGQLPSDGTLTLSVDSAGLALGTYTGTVRATSPTALPAETTVSFTVNAAAQLTAAPAGLTLRAVETDQNPAMGQLTLRTDDGDAASWMAASNQTWLTLSSSSGSTPSNLTVSADPTGLAVGQHMAMVEFSSASASNSPLAFPLTFDVIAAPTITPSTSSLSFDSTQLGNQAGPRQVRLASSAPLDYTVQATTADGSPWLAVTPGGGSLPANADLTVTVNAAGLSPGTYTGTVEVMSQAALAPVQLLVTFVVHEAPLLTASPSTVALAAGELDANPALGAFTVGTDNGDSVSWTATTTASWLTLLSTSGRTPASLTVSADPSGLGPGQQMASIEISSAGASNSPLSIPVTFDVTPAPTLTAAPATLNFEATLLGMQPGPQQVMLSSGGAVDYALTATTVNGGAWLSATPASGSLPAVGTVTVSVDATGLAAGTYGGTIQATSAMTKVPTEVVVSLTVRAAPQLTASPGTLALAAGELDVAAASAMLSISTDNGDAADWTVILNAPWLTLSASNGTTPSMLTVSAEPAGLGAGQQMATIEVTSGSVSNSPLSIPVTFDVTPAATLTAAPAMLTFESTLLGVAAPPQQVTISSGASLDYAVQTATTDGAGWLSATPAAGRLPGASTVTVSVDASGLAPGTYSGLVQASSAMTLAPAEVMVSFTVHAAPQLTVAPGVLTLSGRHLSTDLTSAQLTLRSDSGPVAWTASMPAGWLSLASASGSTPATISVLADPAGLPLGAITTVIEITAPDSSNSPLSIPVTFDISPAPTLTLSPPSLNFNFRQLMPPPGPKVVAVTDGTADALNASVSTTEPWLTASPVVGTVPENLAVTVDPDSLTPGPYHGFVQVSAPGAANPDLQIPVLLRVEEPLQLSVSPNRLDFQSTENSAEPVQPQTLQVDAAPLPAGFGIATMSAGWLQAASDSAQTPATITVTADPTGLSAGTYDGKIVLTAPETAGGMVEVPVSLTVHERFSLTAVPAALTFRYETGGDLPADRSVALDSGGVVLSAKLSADQSWILTNPNPTTTPAGFSVHIQPGRLAEGTHTGSITVNAPETDPISIPVTLIVEGPPREALTVHPRAMTFVFTRQQAVPEPKISIVTGSGLEEAPTLRVVGGNWLTATVMPRVGPGGFEIHVGVEPETLATGILRGAVLLSSNVGSAEIEVEMVVFGPDNLEAHPTGAVFTYVLGDPLPIAPRSIDVRHTEAALDFNVLIFDDIGWLTVAPLAGRSRREITLSADPSALAPGTYSAQVALEAPEAANTPVTIAATLVVKEPEPVTPMPERLTFVHVHGQPDPEPQTAMLGSDSADRAFTIGVPDADWVFATPPAGTSPSTVNVAVTPDGLDAGLHKAHIPIRAGSEQSSLLVILEVLDESALTLLSSALAFSGDPTGLVNSPQPIEIESAVRGERFMVLPSGSPWLKVSALEGTTPAEVIVSADPSGLRPARYRGAVEIWLDGAQFPQAHPVVLDVRPSGTPDAPAQAGPAVVVGPDVLVFSYSGGEPLQKPETMAVQTLPEELPFQLAASEPWILLGDAEGTTPGSVEVNVNPVGLSPGAHSGEITVNVGGDSLTLPVFAYIDPQMTPMIAAAVDGASFLERPAAPGQFVTLFGTGLGPFAFAGGGAGGSFGVYLSDTLALVNGVASPILLSSDGQINVVIPYGVEGAPAAQIEVLHSGVPSNLFVLPLADKTPGLLTLNQSGDGPGAILNQDFSLNTEANPAAPGSVVVLFGGGVGQTDPAGIDGAPNALELPLQALRGETTATVDGADAEVLYAGPAPGLIDGAVQYNIKLPETATGGAVPIVVIQGGAATQDGVTVQVR